MKHINDGMIYREKLESKDFLIKTFVTRHKKNIYERLPKFPFTFTKQ